MGKGITMFKRIVTSIAATLLAATVLVSPAQAYGPEQADPTATAYTTVGVPGGSTVGYFFLRNLGNEPLPAGTVFRISFQNMDGTPVTRGVYTATSNSLLDFCVERDGSRFAYLATTKDALAPQSHFTGMWSISHWFWPSDRAKVIIEVVSAPVDANPDNNRFVYDFGGNGL